MNTRIANVLFSQQAFFREIFPAGTQVLGIRMHNGLIEVMVSHEEIKPVPEGQEPPTIHMVYTKLPDGTVKREFING